MKYNKPHFWFSKRQRNGVFFLMITIVFLEVGYYVQKSRTLETSQPFVIPIAYQKQLDSLKQQNQQSAFKRYPFNPNYISEGKAYQLGMSFESYTRLTNFRAQGKFINTAKQFQEVTQISDSLQAAVSPSFKFPAWVTAQKKSPKKSKLPTIKVSTTDLNKATENDFKSIRGIGDRLAQRIVSYRTSLQGFSYNDQLYEVWNLDTTVVQKALAVFSVQEKPVIQKININTASFKEVLALPYIDYKTCKLIFNYRDEVAEIQSLTELTNIEDFPLQKYDRIVLYLLAE